MFRGLQAKPGLKSRPFPSVRSRNLTTVNGVKKELPIFPLSIVAFPGASCPLHIFEARYRVLFSTLLHGDKDLEEGMAIEDSPFVGSRQFGLAFVNSEGGLAAVGTTLHIKEHQRLGDGRMLIVNQGVERFKITKVVQERPVLVCEVEVMDEDTADSEELRSLAEEAVETFKNVISLNFRIRQMTATKEALEPKELSEARSPLAISYLLASFFNDARVEQQYLLEMESTKERLEREKEVLDGTFKYLSAQVALSSLKSMSVTTEGIPDSEKIDPGPGPGEEGRTKE